MKKLAFVAALLLAASPVAAQVATSNGQEASGEGALSAAAAAATSGQASSGVSSGNAGSFCEDEMTGTFCTSVGAPSNGGFGLTNGSGGTVGSSAPPTPHAAVR